ncbi:MAG: TonB-dependent receptor [Luteibaculaceae bacterium]
MQFIYSAKKYVPVFIFWIILPFSSFAQTTDSSLVELQGVTIQGFSRGVPMHKQAVSVSFISAETLNQFSQQDPVMAWNVEPGVTLEQRAIGSYRLAIRGSALRAPFGVRDVKIYWNGLIYTGANGTAAFNLLSNTQLQNAEIIRGPSGSLYGAGLGGVVHLNNVDTQRENFLEFGTTIGSFNLFQASLQGAVNQGRWSTFYAFDHLQNDGFREHNAINRQVYQVSSRFRINNKNRLDFHVLYSDLEYQIPGGLTLAQFNNNRRLARPESAPQNSSIAQQTLLTGIGYTSYFTPNFSQVTNINFSYTDFDNPFILDYKKETDREFGIRNQWTYNLNKKNFTYQFDAGFEYQLGNNRANNFGNVNGNADTIRFADELTIHRTTIFTQVQVSHKKWGLTTGISSNLLSYDVDRRINAFGNPFQFQRNFNNEIVPRVALQYNWSEKNMSFISISEGFSPPTLDEIRTNEGSINRELQAERGRTVEFGHKYYSKTVQAELTVFNNRLRETITTFVNENGVVLFQNSGETNQFGLETSVSATLLKRKTKALNTIKHRVSYQYYDFEFRNYTQRENDFSGNQLTGVPTHALDNVLQTNIYKELVWQIHHRYVSETPLNDANTVFADAFSLVNTSLIWPIAFKKFTLRTQIGVENLLDITYSLGNDLNAFGGRFFQPAPGRNYFVSVKLRL